MDWDRTLGGMVTHGVVAKHICVTCDKTRPIDVAAMAGRLGHRASLWDYYMPCEFEGCGGLTYVLASPGAGTPFRPLKSYNVLLNADGGWDFLPIWPDTPPFMNGVEF